MGGQVYVDLALYYMDWKRVPEFVNLIVLNAQVAAGAMLRSMVSMPQSRRPRKAIQGLTLSHCR